MHIKARSNFHPFVDDSCAVDSCQRLASTERRGDEPYQVECSGISRNGTQSISRYEDPPVGATRGIITTWKKVLFLITVVITQSVLGIVHLLIFFNRHHRRVDFATS